MILLPDASWEVRDTEKKGRGFFATNDILPGTIIGDYLGKVIPPEEEEQYDTGKDFYLMYYHDTAAIHPDLTKPGIHILNHSHTPNAFMYTYYGHVLFFALRHVFAGEELTIDYMLDPLDATCRPCTHLCYCKSLLCTGTMHLTDARSLVWDAFYEKQAGQTEKQQVTYGEMVTPLPSYPKTIPDDPFYQLFGNEDRSPHELSDTAIPDINRIREYIRKTGKTLVLPQLNLLILGVRDTVIYSKNLQ